MERMRQRRRPNEQEHLSPTIAVAIAPEGSGKIRHYGIIPGGTLEALDKLIERLAQPGIELLTQRAQSPQAVKNGTPSLTKGAPRVRSIDGITPHAIHDRDWESFRIYPAPEARVVKREGSRFLFPQPGLLSRLKLVTE